jgi:hypothetical protein
MLRRSDTNAPANHGLRANSVPDAGVDGNIDGRDNAHPVAPRSTGTADRAMRGDRSPQTPRMEARRVITDLVTVFLARPDFRWLALTNPRLRLCRKRPANGSIWLAMTYGSDGTRTRDLRRGRTALYRRTKDPTSGMQTASPSGPEGAFLGLWWPEMQPYAGPARRAADHLHRSTCFYPAYSLAGACISRHRQTRLFAGLLQLGGTGLEPVTPCL